MKVDDGVPVHIRDVAGVAVGDELRTGAATHDGQEVVIGTAMMLLGANSRTVSEDVHSRVEQIRKTLVPQLSDARLTWIAQTVAEYTETRTERDFEVQMNAILTVGPMLVVKPTELQQLFVRENIKLIRTVPENLLHQTEETILRGIRQGQTSKEIQKSIYRRLDLSKQRARLIARDQTSKYSGDLTRHHQTSVGITHYKWQTSNDERVRSRHANLDGKIFSWSKPPVSDKSGGQNHPRQGINCRCDAIPINKV